MPIFIFGAFSVILIIYGVIYLFYLIIRQTVPSNSPLGNFLARLWWRFSAANREARAPPWPSNTAKYETRDLRDTQDTSARRSLPPEDFLSDGGWLAVLHLSQQSGQTAAHVRQQHVSVLHLLPLATPRRHVALQHGETWTTTHLWVSTRITSATHISSYTSMGGKKQTNIVVEELKTFFTNFLDLPTLLLLLLWFFITICIFSFPF